MPEIKYIFGILIKFHWLCRNSKTTDPIIRKSHFYNIKKKNSCLTDISGDYQHALILTSRHLNKLFKKQKSNTEIN